jgi:hypothetical protein
VLSTHPSHSPVRATAALLVAATGVIHLYLYQDYFSTVATIGPLFLLNFVTGIAVGALILWSRGQLWPVAGGAFCLVTLGAFLISVHWGLFGFHETLSGAWQERAAVIEAAGVIVCAFVVLLPERGAARSADVRVR